MDGEDLWGTESCSWKHQCEQNTAEERQRLVCGPQSREAPPQPHPQPFLARDCHQQVLYSPGFGSLRKVTSLVLGYNFTFFFKSVGRLSKTRSWKHLQVGDYLFPPHPQTRLERIHRAEHGSGSKGCPRVLGGSIKHVVEDLRQEVNSHLNSVNLKIPFSAVGVRGRR